MRPALHRCTYLLPLLLAAPAAWAQPLEGRWSTQGSHSRLGDFTGEVTITKTSDGRYALQGTHRFAGDLTRAWSGDARLRGRRLYFNVRYAASGIVGALEGEQAITGRGVWGVTASRDRLNGSWRTYYGPRLRVRETLTPAAPDGGGDGDGDSSGGDGDSLSVPLDLDLVRFDGSLVPEGEERSEGMVVPVNLDDDDGDGGAGGDGQVELVRDKDDPDGVANEDDLIEVRVREPQGAPSDALLRFRHGEALAVWRSKDRRGAVSSGSTFPAAAGSFWVEGRAASAPGGETLTLELVRGQQTLGRAEVTIHVTRSAFLLVGHGGTGHYGLPSRLRSRAYDGRRDPTITAGKDAAGKRVYWSVYTFKTEKGAKLALSTEGAVVAYDGHSNFGMGFSFETHFRTLAEFMNIADPQVPVNWEYLRDHQEHPQLMFSEAEYGDDASTSRRFDPVKVARTVRGVHGRYDTSRYPVSGGAGERQTLTRGAQRWLDNHYGSTGNVRIVVKAGAKDMPAKRWAALFLNSCYSAQYYADSFGGHGTLFFTNDEVSSTRTSAIFLLGYVDGKSKETILEELNDDENANDYVVFGAQN